VKRTLLLAVKVAVSVALLVYLFTTTDLAALVGRVRNGDTLYLAVAVALYIGMLAMSTWRWRLLLRAQGFAVSLRHLSSSYLVASFFNNFLPSNIGGDIVRVRDSTKVTGSTATSLAVVAIDRIVGLGALYSLAVGAYALGGPSIRHLAGARAMLGGLGFVFGGLAYLFFVPGVSRRFMTFSGLARVEWIREQFEAVQAAVHVYRERVAIVWIAFAASVALQTLVVWYYYAVAHALKIELPLNACFLMVPLCTLVQMVPVSFNGWGIRESMFALYFGQIGLSRDSALAFSLVGATLIVLLSLSGAVVWAARSGERGEREEASADAVS
jgi:uncharacterized protein (TIRG00374 family)